MHLSKVFAISGLLTMVSAVAVQGPAPALEPRAAMTAAPAVDIAHVREARMIRKFGLEARQDTMATQIEDGQVQAPLPTIVGGEEARLVSIPANCTTVAAVPVIMTTVNGVPAIIPAPEAQLATMTVPSRIICIADVEQTATISSEASSSEESMSTFTATVTASEESMSTFTATVTAGESSATPSPTKSAAHIHAAYQTPTSDGMKMGGLTLTMLVFAAFTAAFML